MFYRENGQFKASYRADLALFPVAQDRRAVLALALVGIGVLSSSTHLGRPERAWRRRPA